MTTTAGRLYGWNKYFDKNSDALLEPGTPIGERGAFWANATSAGRRFRTIGTRDMCGTWAAAWRC